jgi:hypothetical protein
MSEADYVGWENIDSRIFTIWVPNMFYRNKQTIFDGDDITYEYTGIKLQRTSIGPSIQGDLYRRFGWLGIIIGYAIYSLANSLLVKHGFTNYHKKDRKIYGLLVLLFVVQFLHGIPAGSVLTMIWNFSYDIPKYLIIFFLINLWIRNRSSRENQLDQVTVALRKNTCS